MKNNEFPMKLNCKRSS